ncbi:MAG: TonB-dependent receptor domain-containing protein [Wenzhouxiangella sp.]
MTTRLISSVAMAGLYCFSLSALADTPRTPDDTVVVTATRAEQGLDDSLAAVSVIDRTRIELSQAPDLLELLRLEAGVDINRTGPAGGQTSVFMRGSNSNHVLVLVDGVRVAASGTGAFAWELIDVNLVERIEIVRGPRAARWGSDAIGGVIQIFTRLPDGPSVRAAYGRYRDRSLTAAAGNGQHGLTVTGRRLGGFSSQNERGFAFDPDDDGLRTLSASGRGQFELATGQLSWHARMVRGEIEFDQGESDVLNYATGLDYRFGQGPDWRFQASTAAYRDRLETEAPFGDSEAITRRLQASFQAERALSENQQLLLGVDGWRESGVNRAQWSEDRYNLGAWIGLDGRQDAFNHEIALRVDRDELFGSAATGNLAGGWRFAEQWQLYASLGRAFRAPNFSQLYSPGFGGLFAGNPDLDPETSWSGEAGLRWQPGQGHQASLALFQTRIDDLIDFAGTDFQAINVRKARIEGIEVSHRYAGRRWQAQAQYTWQDAEDRDNGLPLLRRPRHKAGASVDWLGQQGAWFGVESFYNGSRRDIGQQPLPSYTLVNLRAGLPLGDGLRLEGRLENLTDRDYEQVIGFNTPGRSLFVALSWQGPSSAPR